MPDIYQVLKNHNIPYEQYDRPAAGDVAWVRNQANSGVKKNPVAPCAARKKQRDWDSSHAA